MAILSDKCGVLQIAAERADEHRAAITQAQVEIAHEVFVAVFRDLGIEFETSSPIAKVVAHYLRQASDDGALVGPAPDAEAARRKAGVIPLRELSTDTLRAIERDLRGGPGPEQASRPVERPALPAPIVDPGQTPDPGG